MAFRLAEAVQRGELNNTRKNSVHGWLELRGLDRPILLDLTGNCDPDLAGHLIRFEAREVLEDQEEGTLSQDTDEGEKQALERLNLTGLAWQQIGPTGTMTAARQVRVADCSPEELYARCQLGEPPPTTWKRCLYLEWFSQNGRVVIELVDPIIAFTESEEASGEDPAQAGVAGPDGAGGEADAGAKLKMTLETDLLDEEDEDDEDDEEDEDDLAGPFDDDSDEEDVDDEDDDEEEDECDVRCDENWNVIPEDLQKHLDAQASEVDRIVTGGRAEDEFAHQMELMDELIEHGEREPLGALFDDVVRLPLPDSLDEEGAEQALKSLLARLAMVGVALHICEHFTSHDAYRLLVENLCKEDLGYRELRTTQWVQHFMTSEYCDECEAEIAREAEEGKRGGEHEDAGQTDTEEPLDGDEPPF